MENTKPVGSFHPLKGEVNIKDDDRMIASASSAAYVNTRHVHAEYMRSKSLSGLQLSRQNISSDHPFITAPISSAKAFFEILTHDADYVDNDDNDTTACIISHVNETEETESNPYIIQAREKSDS